MVLASRKNADSTSHWAIGPAIHQVVSQHPRRKQQMAEEADQGRDYWQVENDWNRTRECTIQNFAFPTPSWDLLHTQTFDDMDKAAWERIEA